LSVSERRDKASGSNCSCARTMALSLLCPLYPGFSQFNILSPCLAFGSINTRVVYLEAIRVIVRRGATVGVDLVSVFTILDLVMFQIQVNFTARTVMYAIVLEPW
jgi:hypothetical protein